MSRVACNISLGTICSEFSGRTERCASLALSLAERVIGDVVDSAIEERSIVGGSAVSGASSCSAPGSISPARLVVELADSTALGSHAAGLQCEAAGLVDSKLGSAKAMLAQLVAQQHAVGLDGVDGLGGRDDRDDQVAVFSDGAIEMNLPMIEVAIPVGAGVAYKDVIGNRAIVAVAASVGEFGESNLDGVAIDPTADAAEVLCDQSQPCEEPSLKRAMALLMAEVDFSGALWKVECEKWVSRQLELSTATR